MPRFCQSHLYEMHYWISVLRNQYKRIEMLHCKRVFDIFLDRGDRSQIKSSRALCRVPGFWYFIAIGWVSINDHRIGMASGPASSSPQSRIHLLKNRNSNGNDYENSDETVRSTTFEHV